MRRSYFPAPGADVPCRCGAGGNEEGEMLAFSNWANQVADRLGQKYPNTNLGDVVRKVIDNPHLTESQKKMTIEGIDNTITEQEKAQNDLGLVPEILPEGESQKTFKGPLRKSPIDTEYTDAQMDAEHGGGFEGTKYW